MSETRPDWWDSYIHLKYKLTEKIPARFSELGLLTVEDVSGRLLNNMYNDAAVYKAVLRLVNEGLLDAVYKTEDGKLHYEDMSLNPRERVLLKIKSGTLFNDETGERYDMKKLITLFAIPQEVLTKIPEEQIPSKTPTILGQIRSFLRGGNVES